MRYDTCDNIISCFVEDTHFLLCRIHAFISDYESLSLVIFLVKMVKLLFLR